MLLFELERRGEEEMNNQLTLTDDELSVIQASLQMSLTGLDKYVEINGESSLDYATKQARTEMRELFNKFQKEYFE